MKLNQITNDVKSMQLDDEDASKYFINYISDDSSGLNNNSNEHEDDYIKTNNNDIDVSSLPNSVIISSVPEDLFTNQQMKDEFEQLFRAYDSQITVLYFKFFQRVRITFTSSYNALQARLQLHQYPFHGKIINTFFACPVVLHDATPDKHLRPPEPEKLYLISPPCSPPDNWEQNIEKPPTVDMNLIAAISQLQPDESHELLPNEHSLNAPSIIIHTCEDPNNVEINQSLRQKLIRQRFVHGRRPPSNPANEHI
ncbi:unnamed protein product [Rotaria sp. Silwood2]|nr:unnamed protein product [Rotaria sp. Silwood2]CAF3951460.1 unnamed protein product [Rotaria sp. Silwood2]CAF4168363.1 unnamed protein product [Rotaria sp. Silwood2]CAF4178677.1 unnamed protein product [Rotaria sp. Silwood2]